YRDEVLFGVAGVTDTDAIRYVRCQPCLTLCRFSWSKSRNVSISTSKRHRPEHRTANNYTSLGILCPCTTRCEVIPHALNHLVENGEVFETRLTHVDTDLQERGYDTYRWVR